MATKPAPLPEHERRLLNAILPIVERIVREKREQAAKAPEEERSA